YPLTVSVQAQAHQPRLVIRDVQAVEQTNYPLTLEAIPSSLLGLRISYEGQRFAAATIIRMLGHLSTLLEGFVAAPSRRLADLSLLTDAERQPLLIEWNATLADYPHDARLHTLFETQVARRPDAVALVFAGTGDCRLATADW